jgi:hypothetical protein
VGALRLRWLWIGASALIVAATVYLSLEPATAAGIDDGRDKVEHLLAYACLTLWFTGFVGRGQYLRVAIALAALGAVLELLQGSMHLGRSAEWLDFAANCSGVLLGWLGARALSGGWAHRLEARAVP